MSEGRDKILNMLQAGIINEEDAKRLLEALGESPELTAEGDPARQRAEEFRKETEQFCQEAEAFRQWAEEAAQPSKTESGVPTLTLHPDGMEGGFDVPEIPVPPAPPTPPVPSVLFEDDEPDAGMTVTESMDGRYPEIAAELRSLRVRWVSGSVQVTRGGDEELCIRETANRPLSEGEKTVITFGDGRLTLKWGKHPKWRPFKRPVEKHLEIILPKSVSLESLDIGSISAPVSLRGIDGGRLHANAVSGHVSVENLRGYQIELSTVSGKVEGNGLDAERLELHTVSGKLTGNFSAEKAELSTTSGTLASRGIAREALNLSTVSGKLWFEGTGGMALHASTVSGTQYLALQEMPQTVECGSVSGAIDLRLPDSQEGFSATYSTVSGGFGSEFPVTGKQEKRSGSVQYGQGNTKIEFSTTSGGMRIGRLS